jgi:BASS family bile acid:Na+ symporter
MHKYFWLFLLSGFVLGFILPGPAIWFQPYLTLMIMIFMFFSCLKMNFADIFRTGLFKGSFLAVYFAIYFLQCVIVFLFRGFVSEELFVGLIVTASAPAGIATAFFCQIAGGNDVKALNMTVLTHLISPILIPSMVWLFARQVIAVDFFASAIVIAKMIALPFLLAHIFRKLNWHHYFEKVSFGINTFLLVLLTWGVVAPTRALIFENAGILVAPILIVGFIIVLIFIVGVLPRYSPKDKITLIILSSFKNYTLAGTLALSMFGPIAAIGGVVYMILGNLTIIPLQYIKAK